MQTITSHTRNATRASSSHEHAETYELEIKKIFTEKARSIHNTCSGRETWFHRVQHCVKKAEAGYLPEHADNKLREIFTPVLS